jgi:Tol biopolymer transport system component
MPTLEETMRDALRRNTPTRDTGEVFDHLADRRRRRAVARKVGTIGLVVAVLGGTAGAFALLGHAFGTDPTALSAPTPDNGALVVSLPNDDGFFLYVLPPEKQDLAPAGGGLAAGPDQMRHLTGSGGERDVDPAVSPDGTTVAYIRHASEGEPGTLQTIGIDGGRARQLTGIDVIAGSPAWSPDGAWIAIEGADGEGRTLDLIHPDGTDLHAIPLDQPLIAASPAWSPDGGSIVFSGRLPGQLTNDLWAVSPDGTDLRNLSSTPDTDETQPAWSPDGASIAYVTAGGIERIPAGGGSSETLVSAPTVRSDRLPTQPAWSPDGKYLAFAFAPPTPLPPVVYVLPVGGTTAFPLTQGWSFGWQPVPASGGTEIPTPTTPKEDLGLGYAVCRVTSMPITTSAGPGAAYVFTVKGTDGCPEHADGIAGVDVDNDGAVDATYGPIKDCFFACEAFAAPDINADGTSEIAVSTEGADGYGVSLLAMSSSGPPTLTTIRVEDPQGLAHLLDPLEFAWVDVATHFAGARCGNLDDGTPTLILDGGDKLPPDADVRSTTLVLNGTTATVVDVSSITMPLADAPVPGNELCGTPVYNSAAAFPDSVEPGLDIGIGANICNESQLERDLDGNGTIDTVWVGTEVKNGRCPVRGSGVSIVAVDLDGDGRVDGSYAALPRCDEGCGVFAATDLDADSRMEVVVALQRSATPEYAVYGLARPGSEPSGGILPLGVHPGNPAAGIGDGTDLTFLTGGDEGDSFAVACEGYPSSPTLVLWRSTHPIEGPGSDTRTIDMTKLQLRDGVFAVVDAQHFTSPRSEPAPFDQPATACGVDWGL